MCNLSEVVLEKGIKQGIKQNLISIVCKKVIKGMSLEDICEVLEENIEDIRPIYNVALKYNGDIDKVEDIYNELKQINK